MIYEIFIHQIIKLPFLLALSYLPLAFIRNHQVKHMHPLLSCTIFSYKVIQKEYLISQFQSLLEDFILHMKSS